MGFRLLLFCFIVLHSFNNDLYPASFSSWSFSAEPVYRRFHCKDLCYTSFVPSLYKNSGFRGMSLKSSRLWQDPEQNKANESQFNDEDMKVDVLAEYGDDNIATFGRHKNQDRTIVCPGTVYMVATPIGNLDDITLRAISVLRGVDIIASEDTRHTSHLLQHFAIPRKQLMSHHEHNWRTRAPQLVELALSGKSIAVVSDAGTPGIADPGVELVRACAVAGVRIEPVPGPCALATALSAAGIPADEFMFFGFLPARGSERRKAIGRLLACACVAVLYEAPHRVLDTLGEIVTGEQGARGIVVGRELTKLHEEFYRGTVAGALERLRARGPRGEFTVVLDAWSTAAPNFGGDVPAQEWEASARRFLDALLRAGVRPSVAGRATADALGLPRNAVKRIALELSAACPADSQTGNEDDADEVEGEETSD